jgi:hypothetical protein
MCHFYLLKEHPLQFIGFGPFPFPLGQLGDIHHDILATQKAGTALQPNNNPKIWAINQLGSQLFSYSLWTQSLTPHWLRSAGRQPGDG